MGMPIRGPYGAQIFSVVPMIINPYSNNLKLLGMKLFQRYSLTIYIMFVSKLKLNLKLN